MVGEQSGRRLVGVVLLRISEGDEIGPDTADNQPLSRTSILELQHTVQQAQEFQRGPKAKWEELKLPW
jgi:hypothetical protein